MLPQPLAEYIEHKTNPSRRFLIAKLMLIQFVSAFFISLLCPQWGMQWFNTYQGLRNWFMYLGHQGCEIACGMFYALGFMSTFRLSFSVFERRKFWQSRWFAHLTLVTLALGFIIILGGRIAYLHWVWLVGFAVIYLSSLRLDRKFLGQNEFVGL